MQNAKGDLTPTNMVKEIDKLRDDLVRGIVSQAKNLQDEIKEFKTLSFEEIQAFIEMAHMNYGAKLGGKKGNMQFLSFDGDLKVEITVADHIVFNESLQVAKSLIDEFILANLNGSNDHIRTIVLQAFEVDRKNKVNTGKILNLRSLNIDDELWQRAMNAITDSIMISGSKSYIRVYERDAQGDFKHIALNAAAV